MLEGHEAEDQPERDGQLAAVSIGETPWEFRRGRGRHRCGRGHAAWLMIYPW
jgi:hypothetical protein